MVNNLNNSAFNPFLPFSKTQSVINHTFTSEGNNSRSKASPPLTPHPTPQSSPHRMYILKINLWTPYPSLIYYSLRCPHVPTYLAILIFSGSPLFFICKYYKYIDRVSSSSVVCVLHACCMHVVHLVASGQLEYRGTGYRINRTFWRTRAWTHGHMIIVSSTEQTNESRTFGIEHSQDTCKPCPSTGERL